MEAQNKPELQNDDTLNSPNEVTTFDAEHSFAENNMLEKDDTIVTMPVQNAIDAEEESDEEFLRNFLQNNKFQILNFDIDSKDEADYYDVHLSIRVPKGENQVTTNDLPAEAPATKDIEAVLRDYTPAKNPQVNLIWEGSQFVHSSLAVTNREIAAKVIESDVAELNIIPYEADEFFDADNPKYIALAQHDVRYKDISQMPEEIKKLPYVWVRHQFPPQMTEPKGAKWIVMQPAKYNVVEEEYLEVFHKADEIWTPSNYSRKAFIASGVDYNKVQVVPNGIAPEVFTPHGEKFPLNTLKTFKFLFVGDCTYSKGIDILLDVYTSAFTSVDDVCLIIKNNENIKPDEQKYIDRIKEIQANLAMPEILLISANLAEEEMAELYRSAQVFVSPYRLVSFSLTALEAMACGLPVIVPNHGATDDFVDERVGWKLKTNKVSLPPEATPSKLTHDAICLEVDHDELTIVMQALVDTPAEIFVKGTYASLVARSYWTWRRAAIKMFSRLDSLMSTNMAAEAESALPEYSDSSLDFARAMQLFDEGKHDEAIDLWESIKFNDDLPSQYQVHLNHIIAYIKINENSFDEAEKYLQDAVSRIFFHPDNEYLRSLMLAKKQQYNEVYEILDNLFDKWEYLKYDSTIGLTLDDLLCLKAECQLLEGNVESALEIYSEALKYNTENADACYGLGLCFKQMEQWDEARNMFEWAVKLNPDFALATQELEDLPQ